MASSRGTKLGPKQQAAIEALLRPGSIEDAARETGVSAKKLSGWMKNPAFMAEYRAAMRAEYRQSMASLGQGPTQIMKSILHIMYQSRKPALRLKAALEVTLLANEANEIEDFAAGVADAARMIKAAGARRQSKGVSPEAQTRGHGAKLPRRAEQAIVALLAQRSVAEAARTVDLQPQTLRLWMQDPTFNAKYAEAACAVYGPAMRLAQQHLGDAVLVIRNASVDVAVPEETRLKAAIYRAGALRANVIAHLESRLSGMEPGGAGTGEAQVTSQAIGSSLHQRLQKIRSRLEQASGRNAIRRMILVHSVDGRATGTSVAGPDGRQRWWDPPEGYKKDDLVGEDKREDPGPLQDEAA
jgi:transposase-like protein